MMIYHAAEPTKHIQATVCQAFSPRRKHKKLTPLHLQGEGRENVQILFAERNGYNCLEDGLPGLGHVVS